MKDAFLHLICIMIRNLWAYVCKYVCKDANNNGIPDWIDGVVDMVSVTTAEIVGRIKAKLDK